MLRKWKNERWAFEWIGEVFICLIMHGNQNYNNWQKTFIRNSFSRFKRICQNSVKSHKKKRSSQSLPFNLCIDVNSFRVRKTVNGVNVLWNMFTFHDSKVISIFESIFLVHRGPNQAFSLRLNTFFKWHFTPLGLFNRWTYNHYLLKNPFLFEIFHLDAEQSNLPKWAAPFDSCFCCCCHFTLFHRSNILNQSMKFKKWIAWWSWPWFWTFLQFMQLWILEFQT